MSTNGQLEFSFISQKPGIQLLKKGTPSMKEVNAIIGMPSVKSQIMDIPVTDKVDAFSMGRFAMQPSEDWEFEYTFLEVKTIISGKIIVRDEEGQRYVAEVGDALLFTPNTKVIFDGESDGEAIYVGHRLPEQAFM